MSFFQNLEKLITAAEPILSPLLSTTAAAPVSTVPCMSDRGRRALECEESCRLHAYRDTQGIWTIGYGHTLGVKEGMFWTQVQCDLAFRQDLVMFEHALTLDLKRPYSRQQFDAMLSLEYNIGQGGIRKSSIVADFNSGKPLQQVADDFLKWAHPPELLARRQREAAMFLNGRYRTQ